AWSRATFVGTPMALQVRLILAPPAMDFRESRQDPFGSFSSMNLSHPLGGQATSTVEEIGRHHSEQRSMILFIDGQCELTPETSPRSFSRRNASRSLREGRQSDEQH